MLRSLLAALVLMSGPAWAEAQFNGEVVARLYYTATKLCRQSEDAFGRQVANDVADAACVYRDDFASTLAAHGWCFDRSEQEWAAKCPIVPASAE